jgi:hypothetical protein
MRLSVNPIKKMLPAHGIVRSGRPGPPPRRVGRVPGQKAETIWGDRDEGWEITNLSQDEQT